MTIDTLIEQPLIRSILIQIDNAEATAQWCSDKLMTPELREPISVLEHEDFWYWHTKMFEAIRRATRLHQPIAPAIKFYLDLS